MSKKNEQFKNKQSDKNLNMALPPPDEWGDPPFEPPYEPPTGNQFTPTGWLDSADNGHISGWSYDPDNPSASNQVHIYINGPAGTGTFLASVTADQPRPDVNQALGIAGNHGFSFQVPLQYADGQTHAVYAHGIDTGANSPALLQGCPKYFNLNPIGALSLNQVSPIAGALAGGISVTLLGTGFPAGSICLFR